MPDVLYTPQHPQDPAITEWGGHTFEAGKPVSLDKGRDKHLLSLIDGNPWFSVDGKPKTKASKGAPATAEEYRAYVIEWSASCKSSAAMMARWDAEAPMREVAGWGSEDDDLLQPIYSPRLEFLKSAE